MIENSRNLPILRTEATQSFCEICPEPGRCCRSFYYHRVPFTVTGWQPQTFKTEQGREYAELTCSCPKVTVDGKCSIYEDRPQTCRRFAAGSDPLCVFSSMSGIEFDWGERLRPDDARRKAA